SGRGVPVPSMTSFVAPPSCIAQPVLLSLVALWDDDPVCPSRTLVDVHAGGLDHLGPFLEIGLDAGAGFRAGCRRDHGVLRAELLLQIGSRRHAPHPRL